MPHEKCIMITLLSVCVCVGVYSEVIIVELNIIAGKLRALQLLEYLKCLIAGVAFNIMP